MTTGQGVTQLRAKIFSVASHLIQDLGLGRGHIYRLTGIVIQLPHYLDQSPMLQRQESVPMNALPNFALASLSAAILIGLAGCSSSGFGSKPKEVHEVMEAGFKGKDPALKGADTVAGRMRDGTATDADLKLMVELTRQLTHNKPPKGDLASWTEKTAALHAAARAMASHQPGAIDAWKAAANCKACHSVHKPESQH